MTALPFSEPGSEDLVSIVAFVDKHRLGPTFRLLSDHHVRGESGKVVGYRDLDRIGKTLAPVLVRRSKAQVLKQQQARQSPRRS